MARALELLLLDLLLDEVVRVADGGLRARDGDDAVARAGRERALLGDLDVGARHLLDLHQAAPAGACPGTFVLKRDQNLSMRTMKIASTNFIFKGIKQIDLLV